MIDFRLAVVTTLLLGTRLVSAQNASTTYLQQTSDRYQHTVDVSSDADAAGNHFAARGEFDSTGGSLQVPTMDEISTNAACSGITCITATFNGTGSYWGGWYFLNGILGPTDSLPSSNWGTVPNAGFDLTGATALRFSARGANGGEVVHFFAFGVGNTAPPFEPYPDSSLRFPPSTTPPSTLTTVWTQYQVPLNGVDIHYVLGGFAWLAVASENSSRPITFYLDNIQFVKERPNDPRLVVSYETIKSTNSFDSVERNAAFVYDNAVALIALLAAGDSARARTIADSLLYGQANDRFFTDGRVRNAYQGGDIMLPPGWLPNNKPNTVRMPGWYDPVQKMWFEDQTQVSTSTGNVALAMLALLAFYEKTQESKYLQAVDQLGNWVIANTSDNRGTGGFTAGYEGWENGAVSGGTSTCASGVFVNGQCKRLYKATEHNIDLYAAFSRLNAVNPSATWAQAAAEAKTFFLSMWDPNDGKFWTGTQEDGVTLSTDVIPLDIQAWAIQALGSAASPYIRGLNYVETHHKTSLGYGFKQDGGNSCGDWTWFEGTSQVAVAYLITGNVAKWQSILNSIHSAQLSSGAIQATDGPCLNTGFYLNDGSPWEYFPRAHVGATGWLSLAEMGLNPFVAANSWAPSVVSGVPASGSGSTQTFTFTVADGVGSGNISYAYFLFNSSLSAAGGCYVEFNHVSNSFRLQNDAGSGWLGPITLGSTASLSNSQCTITGNGGSSIAAGNNLAITIPITFAFAFGGAKTVFGYAYDSAFNGSTWITTGSWTVASSGPPVVLSAVPVSGSGSAQTFTLTVADGSGAANISYAYFLFNSSLSAAGGCYVEFNHVSNSFRLQNDAGSGWLGPITLGSTASLSNSQCTITGNGGSSIAAGNNLAITIPITFAFGGAKTVFGYAYDSAFNGSTWITTGSWTVASSGPPAVLSALPASGSGFSETFSLTVADGAGTTNISIAYFLVNSSLSAANACYIEVNRAANTFRLQNDAGTGWLGPTPIGTGTALVNNQCTVSAAAASTSSSGNNLTIDIPVTFTGGFAGLKSAFGYAYDNAFNGSGWIPTGSWNP